MTGLLYLLLVSAGLLLLGGWWQHRRDQQKFKLWRAALEHAERSKGLPDQICWNWDEMRRRRFR